MKHKAFLRVIIKILISIGSVVFAIIFLPWITIYISGLFMSKPSAPQITYGEFPFRLEYEINGEKLVVEDTMICEYDGVGWNEGWGKFRKWKGYLENSDEESVLLINDNTRKIYCFVGSAEYYMGDERYPKKRPLTPRVYMVKLDDMDTTTFTQEELLEKYKIKLISWDFSEPIINDFK